MNRFNHLALSITLLSALATTTHAASNRGGHVVPIAPPTITQVPYNPPEILGIQFGPDYTGQIDDPVTSDGTLENPIGVECTAPFPWQGYIVTSGGKPPLDYRGVSLPNGLTLDTSDGHIVYSALCTDRNKTFIVDFYLVDQTPERSRTVSGAFKVTE